MSWALRRQLTVLFIIVLLISAPIGLFFWLNEPTLSCFDGKLNQGEEGIDCSGPCDLLCPNQASDPIVKWSRVLPVRVGQYDAVAYIENNNPTAGLSDFEYTFRLYDSDNAPVIEKKGRTFLNPGEKHILYEPGINTGNIVPVKAYLELSKPYTGYAWKKLSGGENSYPNLSVKTKEFDSASSNRVSALITNSSIVDGRDIQVVAILYDSNDNVMGASSTFIDVVRGNSELPIVFTWPNPFVDPPSKLELYLHYSKEIHSAR